MGDTTLDALAKAAYTSFQASRGEDVESRERARRKEEDDARSRTKKLLRDELEPDMYNELPTFYYPSYRLEGSKLVAEIQFVYADRLWSIVPSLTRSGESVLHWEWKQNLSNLAVSRSGHLREDLLVYFGEALAAQIRGNA